MKLANKTIKAIVYSILVGIGGLTFFKIYNKDEVVENISDKKNDQVEIIESVGDVTSEISSDDENVQEEVVKESEVVEKVESVESEEVKTDDEEIIEKPVVITEKLTVDANKCIGCKRCVKIAGGNFVMNSSKKAVVISQNNLESESVEKAIKKCPVGAISL